MSFENLAFDVGGYDDDFLDNNHDKGRKTGKKNGIKGIDLNSNKTSNARQSVDIEYEGYYLEKVEPTRTGEKANWTRVSQSRLPFNDSRLEEIGRKQRLETRQNVEKAFETLSSNQQAVVTRFVDTRQVSERNTNAVWSLVWVRKYPARVQKSFWSQTKPPTKKILVIMKREPKSTARNGLGSAVRDTTAYRDTEIIDLADPLPIKPKKNNDLLTGGFDIGPNNGFDFGREFNNDSFGGPKVKGKNGNKQKGTKKGSEVFHGSHDFGADFGDNFREPHGLGLNQVSFNDPFAGVSLGDGFPNDRIPVPPNQHGGPHGQPKNNQNHHHNAVPQDQWNQPFNSAPNMHQHQHNQQPGFGQPVNGAIHVNDWQQQQGHRPQMYDPPRQGPMPYEGHPFQPQVHLNHAGAFELPPTIVNQDGRWVGREQDRRPSSRRRSRSGRPDDPMFLEKVNGWNINDAHSSDESYRDDMWSSPRDRDSRYSFTPPSSPPRSDYLGDRVYPSGSLSRSRSHKYRSGERGRGYPRDRSYERDILIRPHDARRDRRRSDRYESPTRYIVESDSRRKKPLIIQRTLTDYPSHPVADFRDRKSRYLEDDRIDYEVSGRRGGDWRRNYEREERYYDDRGRRGGGRRMSMMI